jgi:hypothetical protein
VAAVVRPHDDRVGVPLLRDEVGDADVVELREPVQAPDRDVAAAGLDQREERARDRGRVGDLREREAARLAREPELGAQGSLVGRGLERGHRVDGHDASTLDRDAAGEGKFVQESG